MIKINKKEYNYKLQRKHVFMMANILGSVKIKPQFKNTKSESEISIVIKLFQEMLANFQDAEESTLEFIISVYNIPKEEIEEMGVINELKLWEHLLEDKEIKSFFSRWFKQNLKKKLS